MGFGFALSPSADRIASLDEVIDFDGVPTTSDFTEGVLYIRDTNTSKLYQLYDGSPIELNSNKVDKLTSASENSIPRVDASGNLKESNVIIDDNGAVDGRYLSADGAKLDTFTINEFNTGLLSMGVYLPYIDYYWSSTYQMNNQMYSKSIGTNSQALELHSGQGVKFDGVDQNVGIDEVSISGDFAICLNAILKQGHLFIGSGTTVTDYIYCESDTSLRVKIGGTTYTLIIPNDIDNARQLVITRKSNLVSVYINNTLIDTITNSNLLTITSIAKYNGSSSFGALIKDLYIFNDIPTQDEISLYSTNPNKFFNNVREGIIDNCVLNMPLDGSYKHVKDYANYSEVEKFTEDFSNIDAWDLTTSTFQLVNGTAYCVRNEELIASTMLPTPTKENTYYSISYDISNMSNTTSGYVYMLIGGVITEQIKGNGTFTVLIKSGGASSLFGIRAGGVVGLTFNIDNISVQELSGIHQIENYTNSCRDEAKQLTYGSQEANYTHDTLGFRDMPSDYFECSKFYSNYGDTGSIDIGAGDFSFEVILKHTHTDSSGWDWIAEFGNNSDKRLVLATQANKIRASLGQWFTDMFTSTIINIDTGYVYLVFLRSNGYCKGFVNGVEDGISKFLDTDLGHFNMTLGKFSSDYFDNTIRLFKVHQKHLAQEEVTENYNKYQSQGLLDD